jgi:hypothetical protein
MFRKLAIAVISTFLLIPIAGYSSNIIKNSFSLIAVSVIVGYIIIPALLLKLWPERSKEVDSMEVALAKGSLLSQDFEIEEVVEIREFEDEGAHYLFSIASNRTLSLFGQYLYEYKMLANFPSKKIRVFSNAKEPLTYGLQCLGEKLEISKSIASPTSEAWAANVVPFDLQIVEKPLSVVVGAIEKYA